MPSSPLLFEVYVRQWLHALGVAAGRRIDLSTVPAAVIDAWAQRGVSHVWLMGVWPTGPRSREESRRLPDLRRAYDEALPAWVDADVCGSPYAVAAYEVAAEIGGDEGLASLRARLAARGIKVILDFVPNHTGLDHRFATARPELYVGATASRDGATELGGRWLSHGKDPYFPGWTDTLQLDYRRADTHAAMADTLSSIAARCDGVRCDMAMLVLPDVFERTWAHVLLAADAPRAAGDFGAAALARVKAERPGFVFLAEAYWDLEDRLCALGFDFAYDKRLYDLLHHGDWAVAEHLAGQGDRVHARAHFLENHDEPRAAVTFGLARHRVAALLALALPGMRFVHDGQLEGRRVFARIQLARRAPEAVDEAVRAMYDALFTALAATAVGDGACEVLDARSAWEGNPTHRAFTVLQWQRAGEVGAFDLVVVSQSDTRAQCWVRLSAEGLAGGAWELVDGLSTERYVRDGDELANRGLYLDVAPHAAQVFRFRRCAA